MEVVKAYKIKQKIQNGKGELQPIPRTFPLVLPTLRRHDVGDPKKSRHMVLQFENGALYIYKQDGKFYATGTSGALIEMNMDPCPAIEKHSGFGRDFIVAVVEAPKPKVESVPPPPKKVKAPLVEPA